MLIILCLSFAHASWDAIVNDTNQDFPLPASARWNSLFLVSPSQCFSSFPVCMLWGQEGLA